jgi:hypothetical protein
MRLHFFRPVSSPACSGESPSPISQPERSGHSRAQLSNARRGVLSISLQNLGQLASRCMPIAWMSLPVPNFILHLTASDTLPWLVIDMKIIARVVNSTPA